MKRAIRRRGRHGFTLVEVLATLAIVGVMGYCVLGLMMTQAQWRERGERVAEQGQQLGGFQFDLAADLCGVASPPIPVSQSSEKSTRAEPAKVLESLQTESFQTESFREMLLNLPGGTPPQTIRFLGSETLLVLEVPRGNTRFDEPAERTVVVWWCAGTDATRIPLLRLGDRLISVNSPTNPARGITRWSAAASQLLSMPTPRTLEDVTGSQTVVLPAGITWTLAYFDGSQWRDRWDEQDQRSLPQAVRVRCQDRNGLPLPPVVIRLPTAGGDAT